MHAAPGCLVVSVHTRRDLDTALDDAVDLLLPVGTDAAEGLYRLVDAAYEKRSIAVSSNLHPSGFDELMPKTLATGNPSASARPWQEKESRQ
jgi:hypothetical protein